MDDTMREQAEERLEAALAASGSQDPRGDYRSVLREMKEAHPEAYEKAVGHYQEVLVPGIASGEMEPLAAWRDYGRLIAVLQEPGRTVAIDIEGTAEPFSPETPMDRLVLHLPDAKGPRAFPISVPAALSEAQEATFHLLVFGRVKLPG